MKNALKKIAAVAMAFTMLGAGVTATKTVYPKSDNSLVAHAGMPPQYCKHNNGKHITFVSDYRYNPYCNHGSGAHERDYYICCNQCGTPLSGKTTYVGSVKEIRAWADKYNRENR